MKNLICALFLSFMALSCSKDEEEITIVGTWNRSQVGEIAADGTISNLLDYSSGCTTEKDYFSFATDGVYKEVEWYSGATKSAKVSRDVECGKNENIGTYNLTGNSLRTTYSTSSFVSQTNYEIVSLTSKELKIKSVPSSDSKTTPPRYNYFTFTKR
jgi:hypothetical protein